ncbi:unnamed protein product [Amoebophrya sp. A25]|nr:unnamed protein product [Amoebophrya sp. A25]|eukprot:GSA25T00001206001.1
MPPGSCLTTAGEQLAQYEQQASAHEQHMEEVQGELQGLRAIVEKQLLEIRRLETAQQQEREEYEAQLAQQNAAAEAQLQKALLAKNPHAVRGISGSSSSSSSSASSASENTNKQRGDVLFVGGRLVASPSEAEVSGTPLEPPDAGSISERGEDHSKDAARSRREEQEDKSKSDAEKWEDEAWHWKRKCQDLREKWNKELQQMREQDHAALTQAVQEKCAEFHSALEQERAGLQVQLEQTELMLRQDADHRERALRRDSDHRLRDRENALRDEFAQKSAALQAELERELTKMQADCDARIGSSNAAVGFEAQLQQRVAELQQREGEVGQREAELQQREVNVAQGEQGIQDCQSAVLEREEEMKQCGSALEEQANHLASREQDIAERDAALAERAAEVDRSLAERSTALQAQFEQLKEQAEQVNEQAEEVQRWREELEQAREKDQQWQVEYESEYLARQKLQERCDELESECVRKEDILRSHVEKATAAEEIVREKERELLDAASQLRVAQAESEAQKSRISSLESRVLSLSERHDAEYADHTSRAERLQVALLETQARADAAAAEAEGSNRLVDQLRTEEENYYRRLQAADSRIAELEEALQAQQPGGSAVSAGQRPASISSKDTTSTREQKLGAETQEANVGNLDSRVSIARKLSRHLVGEGTPPEPSCHFVRALSVEELYPAARSPNDPPGGPLDYSRGVSPADAPPGVSQVLLCRTEIAEAAKRSQLLQWSRVRRTAWEALAHQSEAPHHQSGALGLEDSSRHCRAARRKKVRRVCAHRHNKQTIA